MKRKLDTYYVSWVGLHRNGDGLDVPVRAKSHEHAAGAIVRRYINEFDKNSTLLVTLTKRVPYVDVE